MADKTASTGKSVSMWMDYSTIDALSNEAELQNTSKSKVLRAAVLRYADEMNAERAYNKAMEEARSRKYD